AERGRGGARVGRAAGGRRGRCRGPARRPLMDPAALKASWSEIVRHGDAVPGFFYAWLFTGYPHLREFFPMSMAAQRDRLVAALGREVSQVEELTAVVAVREGHGRDPRSVQRHSVPTVVQG